MAKRPSWVLKKGTPVSWTYRSATGHGYVVSVVKLGTSEAKTEYKLRQVDKHPGEPKYRNHFGSDITVVSRKEVEHAAKKAKKRNAKKALDHRLAAVSDALDRLGV